VAISRRLAAVDGAACAADEIENLCSARVRKAS
jgi:hypothetical protein